MTVARGLLLIVGLGLLGHGLRLLWTFPIPDLRSIAAWFVAGILIHDVVFAPLCAAAGFVASRVIPRNWWGVSVCGAVCTVVLILIMAPVVTRGGRAADIGLLDRNYPAGLVTAIAVVWVVLLLVRLVLGDRAARR
ncbi:hypothetical protein [Nocardia paucivorans]|uniref:hypothetical protein n=1 Tax=Nocardia paucivorans TaxID=114259 RepID=UPI0002EE38A9|nr:hypothetical protein [Nocardia paucivorans]